MSQVSTNTTSDAFSRITRDIRVSVVPNCLPFETDPENNVFAFSYTVIIENFGDHAAQLLKRHWVIDSGGEPFSQVDGEGVIGEQPLIQPSEVFEYTSWSVIKDPIGSMVGKYVFRSETGEQFNVDIPSFSLINPAFLH